MISFIQLTFVEIGFQDNKQKATKTIEFESTSKNLFPGIIKYLS